MIAAENTGETRRVRLSLSPSQANELIYALASEADGRIESFGTYVTSIESDRDGSDKAERFAAFVAEMNRYDKAIAACTTVTTAEYPTTEVDLPLGATEVYDAIVHHAQTDMFMFLERNTASELQAVAARMSNLIPLFEALGHDDRVQVERASLAAQRPGAGA